MADELKHVGEPTIFGRRFAVVHSVTDDDVERWTVLENTEPDEDPGEYDDFVAAFATREDAEIFASTKTAAEEFAQRTPRGRRKREAGAVIFGIATHIHPADIESGRVTNVPPPRFCSIDDSPAAQIAAEIIRALDEQHLKREQVQAVAAWVYYLSTQE